MLKIRNVCEKNLLVVYPNDTVLPGVCLTILVKNQILLNETKLDKIRK